MHCLMHLRHWHRRWQKVPYVSPLMLAGLLLRVRNARRRGLRRWQRRWRLASWRIRRVTGTFRWLTITLSTLSHHNFLSVGKGLLVSLCRIRSVLHYHKRAHMQPVIPLVLGKKSTSTSTTTIDWARIKWTTTTNMGSTFHIFNAWDDLQKN